MLFTFSMNAESVSDQKRNKSRRVKDVHLDKSALVRGEPPRVKTRTGLAEAQTLEGNQMDITAQPNRRSPTDSTLTKSQSEKMYLGVRVRMPVRDLLRKIRIAKGLDPSEFQVNSGKASLRSITGEKRRVHPFGNRKKKQNKHPLKSLEDLAMLVEVLEEDLKASKPHRCTEESECGSSQPYNTPSPYTSVQTPKAWVQEFPAQQPAVEYSPDGSIGSSTPSPQTYCLPTDFSPASSPDGCDYFHSPPYEQTPAPSPGYPGGYYSDNSEDLVSSMYPQLTYQVPSPPDSIYHSPKPHFYEGYADSLADPPANLSNHYSYRQKQDWNGLTFFHFQLQREENLIRGISDQELLAVDKKGRTMLHNVVCQGKRAPVYAIAKRMAALNRINAKDTEGKTALHLAAEKNQHLMVADLISLGANVNSRDKFGKTSLHLCAENGYIRVLEMLKTSISDGMSLEVEATDNNGLTPFQCAVIAANMAVKELQNSKTHSEMKFQSLRKEQLFETLEYLLQIGGNLYTTEQLSGHSAVHIADMENNPELVHLLQRHNCKLGNIDDEDYASQTMLDVMCNMGSLYENREVSDLLHCTLLNRT
ncbi:NF-kappa-B inhibitor zeta isoform X2 [Amia ocellicauda]|uniref:NF-kappa-B inhibitor zeta isoform X2 n=1 Tax=Amia ocellicauda TaxID=2972642 RepID=UPI003463C3E0